MLNYKDMINGTKWRNQAEFHRSESRRQRAYSAHLENALEDSYGMLGEQQARARQSNHRTARRSFREGYDAALEQARREMGVMSK